jgi:hypothetical protein
VKEASRKAPIAWPSSPRPHRSTEPKSVRTQSGSSTDPVLQWSRKSLSSSKTTKTNREGLPTDVFLLVMSFPFLRSSKWKLARSWVLVRSTSLMYFLFEASTTKAKISTCPHHRESKVGKIGSGYAAQVCSWRRGKILSEEKSRVVLQYLCNNECTQRTPVASVAGVFNE